MKITKLFCFPADYPEGKPNPKSPDYRLSAQIGTGFTEVGAGWKGVTKEGKKYISFTLKEVYDGKPGYAIGEDSEPRQKAVRQPSAAEAGADDWDL